MSRATTDALVLQALADGPATLTTITRVTGLRREAVRDALDRLVGGGLARDVAAVGFGTDARWERAE
jgi:DNA-binding IclR family transcriptional regulator